MLPQLHTVQRETKQGQILSLQPTPCHLPLHRRRRDSRGGSGHQDISSFSMEGICVEAEKHQLRDVPFTACVVSGLCLLPTPWGSAGFSSAKGAIAALPLYIT